MDRLNINDKQDVTYAVPIWQRDMQIQNAISKIKERVTPIESRIEEPIAIVGFGPSLKKTWEKVKQFKYVISCSGAHKFLIERGIIPKYHVEVDPRDHKIKLIGEPHKDVEYLIASTCSPKYFEHLNGFNVKLWHVFDSTDEGIAMLPPGEWAVTGGCDVGLRSITLAAFLGYRNLHIFGMDGCAEESGERHADYHPNGKQPYKEVECNGKIFLSTPGMLEASKQVLHELEMMPAVTATFYGDGLTQELYKTKPIEIKKDTEYQNVIGFQKPELITKDYVELNKQLHKENAVYGIGGGKHAETILKLCEVLKTNLVLDYGCGKGHLAKALPFPIWEYDPGVPGKEDGARPADIVVCTDVLEHIEPELLDNVLGDLARCVKQIGYFVIHTGAASKTLPDGRNTHLIQRGLEWWKEKLTEYFTIGKIQQVGFQLEVVVGVKMMTMDEIKNKKNEKK